MDLTKQPLKKAKSFFDYDNYVIDEKVSGLSNSYNVLGPDGQSIGTVVQKASALDKILGFGTPQINAFRYDCHHF